MDLTLASHRPPKWGDEGGLKCHEVLRIANLFCTSADHSADMNLMSPFTSVFAPLKLVPQSLNMFVQIPLRATNLLNAAINAAALRSLTNYM